MQGGVKALVPGRCGMAGGVGALAGGGAALSLSLSLSLRRVGLFVVPGCFGGVGWMSCWISGRSVAGGATGAGPLGRPLLCAAGRCS